MPNFDVTLPNGSIVTVDADRQPTPEAVMQYLQRQGQQPGQQTGAPTPTGEQPKTSAAGAFTRAAVAEAGPTAAAMAAFPGGATFGAEVGSVGGPIGSAVGGLIGGGLAATGAAIATKWGQHKIAHVLAPETVDNLDKLRDADIVQHPVAEAAGGLAAMIPSFRFAGLKNVRGLAKIPALMRGSLEGPANEVDKRLAKTALNQIGTQAALTVGQTEAQSLYEQHKLTIPTAAELAQGAVAAVLFHEPRFKRLPNAVEAAAASLVEKGKGLYATKEGQVQEGVPPERAGDDARRASAEAGARGGVSPATGVEAQAQVSLTPEKASITGNSREGYTVAYGGATEHYSTLYHAKQAADELETRKRAVVSKPGPGLREGEHQQPLTEAEEEERRQQVMDAVERGRAIDEKLADTAKKMGIAVQQHEEPLQTDENNPFADRMAYMDKATGVMHFNRDRLHRWLRNIPEGQHARAIETLVNHEKIHKYVSDKDAMDYWNNLTALEKWLVKKRYTGHGRGLPDVEVTDKVTGEKKMVPRHTEQQFAHEAIRGRIEQLSHMTPTEVVDAVAEEHWSNRMIYWMEDMIARLRKQFNTTASRAQQEILDRVMNNLEIAREQTEPLRQRGEEAPPEAFQRHAEDPEDIAKEIGYDFKRNEFPGMKGEGMSEEDKAKFREAGLQPVWEFTNRSAGTDDPMGGHTFYVPEGASRTDIIRRYNEARRQFGQPPEAYNRRKETAEERTVRELHEAQAFVSAVERRKASGMAVNTQEEKDARTRLEQAWKNALDAQTPDFPEAFQRGREEEPYEPSRAAGGGSKQYPATPEDWAEWQRLRAMPVKKPDGTIDYEMMRAREEMKNKYGGMPPLEPGSRPIEAFDRRRAEEELRRREAERLARIKRKSKKGTAATEAGLFGEETTVTPTPKQVTPSSSVEEEQRRREAASARKVHREALESTDVPAGAGTLGQQSLFMPPSAERVVEPVSAVEAGATPGMTAAQVTGIHGAVDAQGNPIPDKPGFVDDYLNGAIEFSAAPRTRTAEVQGEEIPYEETRRRSKRPNFDDFKTMLAERLGAHWPEERVREVWNDAIWRQLQEAPEERLIEWAKSSRSKILASWQTGTDEDLLRRLVMDEPETEVAKAQEKKGVTAKAQPETGEFALEQMREGETEKQAGARRHEEYLRLRREQLAQLRERAKGVREKEGRANKNRQTIIGQIGLELMNEAKPVEQPLNRTHIDIDDIDYGNTSTAEGAVRDISEEEAKNPDLLAAILGDKGARSFSNAANTPVSHTKRVVALLDRRTNRVHLVSTYPMGGRGEVEVGKVAKEGKPVEGTSITKKAPKRIMVVDPEAAGVSERPNADIKELLARKVGTTEGPQEQYRPIQTMLVRNPLLNFIETYDSPEHYFGSLGTEASERQMANNYQDFVGEAAEQRGGLPGEEIHREGFAGEVTGSSSERPPERPGVPRGTGVAEGEGGMFQGPHAELGRGPQLEGRGRSLIKKTQRTPIQASEALALQDHVLESTGGDVTREGFKEAIAQAVKGGYLGKSRKVVSAVVKAMQKAWDDERERYFNALKEWRGLGRERRKETPLPVELTARQVYDQTLEKIYQAITSTDTAGQYVQAIMGQFGRPAGKELPTAGRPTTAPTAQGVTRELTMRSRRPPTDVAGLARGVAPQRPEGTPGAVLPPEMLPARPEAAGAQPEGPKPPVEGEVPVPMSPTAEGRVGRGLVLDPFAYRRAEDPTTLRRMVPSPGEPPIAGAPPGQHPLARPSPWEGRFRAEAVREVSQREPNVLEAEAARLRAQRLRQEGSELQKKGKYLPGMGPEAFDRNMERLKTDWDNLRVRMAGRFTRHEAKESIHTERDATENIGNIDAANRGNITRDASKGAVSAVFHALRRFDPRRALGREAREQAKKAAQVRKAAVAVVSSGEIVSGGPTYVDKYGNTRQRSYWQSNKQKLTAPMAYLASGVPDTNNSGLIAMAEDAMRQAQFTMTKSDPWYQMMGQKWYDAAKELRDAAVWARDHWLDPELKRTVATAREQLRDQWQKEANAGMRMRRDWNYVPGRYDAELWNDDHVFFGRPRILGRNFRQPATFNNYYDAIHAGPYIAKNLDIADLVEHRSRQGNQMIGKNNWYTYLMGATDPHTGNKIATEIQHGEPQPIMEKGQLLRDKKTGRYVKDPQGNLIREPDQPKRDEKGTILTTPGKTYVPAGYEPVVLDNGRKILAVLTGYKDAVRMAAGESAIRQWPISASLLHFQQYLKHYGILIYDSFHPARLIQYAAALGGLEPRKLQSFKVGAGRGYAALEYRPEDLDRAVEVGSVMKSDADWARENVKIRLGDRVVEANRHEILRMALGQGANLGRLQDALFSQTKHWLPGVDWMNRKVFREITRGLMSEAIVRNFEAQNAAHPNVNALQLMRGVAKDMNFFFGSIGRQGLVKSPLARDFLQMVFLAPQWVEGLAQKEARFYGRLATAPAKFALGREGPYLGALGGAMAKGLGAWFVLTQVFNLITRGQFTFQNEEEGHGLDAWVPAGHSGFWISPMGVFAELSHDVLRMFETKPTAYDALEQIGRNKLGPWGRMAAVLATKQNNQGEFIPTTWGRLKAAGEEVVPPIPITGSWLLRTGGAALAGTRFRGLVPESLSRPPQPGSFARQLLASGFGVKGQPADSPLQRMQRLASRYVQQNKLRTETMEMIPTTEPSYSKLRSLLRADDAAGAEVMLNDIRQNHTDTQIYHAMSVWARAPLTGSVRNERAFIASLTPQQLQIYSQAMEERLNLFQSYLQVYQNSYKHQQQGTSNATPALVR